MGNALASVAASILALFGGMSSTTGNHPPSNLGDFFHHATSTMPSSTTSVQCVAAAVATREAALDSAIATHSTAIDTAYTDRASALASAYTQTSISAIRQAINTAWKNFQAAIHLANKSWKTAQQNAWSQFATAVKACGPSSTTLTDTANASLDLESGETSEGVGGPGQ